MFGEGNQHHSKKEHQPYALAHFANLSDGIHYFKGKKVAIFVSIGNEVYLRKANFDALLDGLLRGGSKSIEIVIGGSFQALNREYSTDYTDYSDQDLNPILMKGHREGLQWVEKFNKIISHPRYKEKIIITHTRYLETQTRYQEAYSLATQEMSSLRCEDENFQKALKITAEGFEVRELNRIFEEVIAEHEGDSTWLQTHQEEIGQIKNEKMTPNKTPLIKEFLHKHAGYNLGILFNNFQKSAEIESRYYQLYLNKVDAIIYPGREIPIFEYVRKIEQNKSEKPLAEWCRFNVKAKDLQKTSEQDMKQFQQKDGIGFRYRDINGEPSFSNGYSSSDSETESYSDEGDLSEVLCLVEVNDHGEYCGNFNNILNFIVCLLEKNAIILANRILTSLLKNTLSEDNKMKANEIKEKASILLDIYGSQVLEGIVKSQTVSNSSSLFQQPSLSFSAVSTLLDRFSLRQPNTQDHFSFVHG